MRLKDKTAVVTGGASGPAALPPSQRRRAKGTGTTYVYQRLREGILSLDYAPGANLDEAQLVESFGLSRTPVREALIRLAADGLVVLLPNRGAQVAPVDLTDFPRYVEAFDLVQRAVTRFAAMRAVAKDLARIRKARDSFESAVGRGDSLKLTERNRDFHLAIGEAAGNPYLARHYGQLLDQGMRLLRVPFAYEPNGEQGDGRERHLEKIVGEHRAITAAIADGDFEQADALAHAHTELFRGRLVQYLSQNLSAGMVLD